MRAPRQGKEPAVLCGARLIPRPLCAGSSVTAALTSRKIREVLVLGATGGTGRLIVRFRRGYGSLEGERQSAASRHDRGDARDEDIFTRSLVVKDAESPRLMHDREAVPPMQRVDFSRVQEPTCCRTI